jgi:hypothetical protein
MLNRRDSAARLSAVSVNDHREDSAGSLDAPAIREAQLEDYDQIRPLLSRHNLQNKPPNEWRQFWLDNPLYKDLDRPWPMGWVLTTGPQRIVGHLANVPLGYELDGRKLVAAAASAWAVDDAFRSYSLALMGRYFGQSGADLLLITSAGRKASKVFDAFRVRRVPTGCFDRANFWITHYRGFAASLLLTKGVPLSSALNYPLAVYLLITDQVAGEPFSRLQASVDVQQCAAFDDRFDSFWHDLRLRKSKFLLAVRTRQALDWRFATALSHGRARIFVVERHGRLVAYSIFHRQDHPPVGLKRLRLVDFQTLETAPDLLPAMIGAAIRSCRAEGIHMLETIGFRESTRTILDELAPYRRTLPSWLYYYKAKPKGLAEELSNDEVWDPSLFDGDACL